MEEKIDTDKPKEKTNIEKANETVAALKAENDRTEKLLERQEALKVEATLSGQSEAGKPAEPPKEETPAEYVGKVMGGDA